MKIEGVVTAMISEYLFKGVCSDHFSIKSEFKNGKPKLSYKFDFFFSHSNTREKVTV